MDIISRADARAAGRTRYFTGKPCKRGHVAERLVSVKACLLCQREHDRRWAAANPEKLRAKWRAKNPEKRRASARARYLANPAKVAATVRAWEAANPDKVRAAGRVRSAKRRSRKKAAAVPLTAAEQAQISLIYAEADRRTAETGIVHEVDHDKPLARGGTHHPANLIVVPRRMNRAKGARYESTFDFILN